MPPERVEITDLIIDYDPETLARKPVRKDDVLAAMAERRMGRRAARIVAGLPDVGGVLDEAHLDALFVRIHAELQRLNEEFRQGERLLMLLEPMLRVSSAQRVVDVGCGLGYVVRWLAAHRQSARGTARAWGDGVELLGCDYNRALVTEAQRLAEVEALECAFRVANAFRLREQPAVFTSSGVIHHFRGDALAAVFRAQAESGAVACIHFDIKPSWVAPMGAYVFHEARMRERVSRHDGVLSAVRAHPAATLLQAARAGAPEMVFAMFDGAVGFLPILRVMHAVVGVRREHAAAFRGALGPLGARLSELS
ncbi:MAG: class I SAM-dependent methyltransferase [Polyangiaceae bacterium]|nr:class I SAM-dependent methyltransferase [Polyangiaceae bacterium]